MRIVYYAPGPNGRPGTEAQPLECSWEELGKLIQARVSRHTCEPQGKQCRHKLAGEAWSPVELDGYKRANASVEAVHALVYDLDNITQQDLVALGQRLQGRAYYIHSTHGHNPVADSWCLRLLLPLASPFNRSGGHGATFKAQWRTAWATEARGLGIPVDEAAKDPSRLYFFPSLPEDSEWFWAEQDGAPTTLSYTKPEVLPQDVVASSPDGRAAAAPLEEIRRALTSRGKNEERTQMRSWIDGAPLAPPGKQDPTAQSLAWKIARLAPEATDDQIMIMFGPCLRATEWSGPDAIEDWFRSKLERARADVAEQVAAEAAKAAEQERMLLGVLDSRIQNGPPGEEGIYTSSPGGDSEWLRRLIEQGYRTSKDGEPLKFKADGHVVMEVLKHSEPWRGVFRYNQITNRIDYPGAPIPLPPDIDSALPIITSWFSSNLGMHGLYTSVVWEQIMGVASLNAYDPLADYLNGLVWDGVPRIDKLLSEYVPTADRSESCLDLTAYRAMVGRRWMLSAVARALEPGCKADSMIVFSGLGGRRKSQFGEILGGEWQTTYGQSELGGRDSKIKLAQHWIVEIEELAAFNDKSKETIKKDISERSASVRPAYGRNERLYKRRCVFYGTTNDAEYIPEDEGGYRRFWPLRVVSDIDLARLKADRNQLWAEAVHIFKDVSNCDACSDGRCENHRWWFEREEEFPVDQIAEDSVSSDPLVQIIIDFFTNKPVGTRPLHIRTADIMRATATPANMMTRTLDTNIGRALRKLKFEKKRKFLNGIQQTFYLTPKALLEAPVRSANKEGIA